MLRQHNGEPQEDAMEGFPAAAGWLDDEIGDSFPASDPLSHWAGPRRRELKAERTHGHRVPPAAVEQAPERQHPEDPKPGTLIP